MRCLTVRCAQFRRRIPRRLWLTQFRNSISMLKSEFVDLQSHGKKARSVDRATRGRRERSSIFRNQLTATPDESEEEIKAHCLPQSSITVGHSGVCTPLPRGPHMANIRCVKKCCSFLHSGSRKILDISSSTAETRCFLSFAGILLLCYRFSPSGC